MASPSPLPWRRSCSSPTWRKLSNTRGRSLAPMPTPVSRTRSEIPSSVGDTWTLMVPSRVNLIALPSRFCTT